MTTQPIPLPDSTGVDEEQAHRRRDLARLVSMWRHLAAEFVAAEAHGLPDEVALARALAGVEDALRRRHRRAWRAMQNDMQEALLRWAHDPDPALPKAGCLVCRRITRGLPLSLPLPASTTGGVR